ncbi:uncharacterized protein N7506_000205 [Penicillium brevicompactum]|uniref:uncharacterized protein n=1 Tax=Penicillium brevicompactum TaxID=5074 RepID=UPI00254011A9|nr:uncharacterized protein N7506_000205 [Penicillium brevicompactum]KAJ5346952.1 hypothetical protein N7506_000205 [Penicillium brevicompactum]
MLDRRDNIEPCHTNTCNWILELEEYQSWKSQSHGLLWIKGKPGAGKSTLMLFLHDKLETSEDGRPSIRLDFFFTARGTEMQRTPLGMLRSLLSQIFDRDPTIRPYIRETYDRRCKQFGYGKHQWEWPQVMLEELLASAILVSANRHHVVVFVDALDEAGAQSAQQLAEYFHRLVDRAAKEKLCIQVCISCRHYPIMKSGQAIEIKVEDHNQQVIASYIQDILIQTETKDSVSQKMREMLVEQLTRQANGFFQWVHTILPLIEKKIRERESFYDICCWLREVPAGLEDVYAYILSNVIDERNREQSFLFFQWVCLAERPLTVAEMRYALVAKNARATLSPKKWETMSGFIESNEHMLQRIKALSGGLAEVVPSADNTETIQVVHQSVNDFLRTKGLKILYQNLDMSTSSVNEEQIVFRCQANLYRSCLVYLATIHKPAETSGLEGTKESLVQDHPFIHYATTNLFAHAEKAFNFRSNVLYNEKEILQQVLSPWVHIYQKLDGYSGVCPPRDTTLLHMATAANLVDLIEPVLSDVKDVAIRNRDGDTALHLAARWGHVAAGKILQRRGADQEAKNYSGKTPLLEAASGGHIEFVEWLLDEGVDLGIEGDGGVLQAASLGGYESVVEIMLGAGADVNDQGSEYGNALQAAAFGGSSGIMQMLLDAGADVNAQGGHFGNSLQAAAYKGSAETVQILLGAGADVNAQGGHFGNALQAAACSGSAETVQILLGAGADVNAQGGEYGDALQAAASKGNAETVQILLGAGADVNVQGGQYRNALQAAFSGGHDKVLRLLLGRGADVDTHGGEYGSVGSILQASIFDRGYRSGATYLSTIPTSEAKSKVDSRFYSSLDGSGLKAGVETDQDETLLNNINPKDDVKKDAVGECCDTETTYSIDFALDHSSLLYVQAFADQLAFDLRSISNVSNISDISPDFLNHLLKAFTWTLHRESSTPFQWEAAATIHRQRRQIINHVTSGLQEIDPGGDDKEASEGSVSDDELLTRKPFEKNPHEVLEWVINTEPEPSGVKDRDQDANTFDTTEEQIGFQLPEYEKFIQESMAYKDWLLPNICQIGRLEPGSPNLMRDIGLKVRSQLGAFTLLRKMSHRRAQSLIKMTYNLDWDPANFIHNQYFHDQGLSLPPIDLEEVVCLTGSWSNAQAATVADYMGQTWPGTGKYIMTLLKELICLPKGQECVCKSPN